MPPLFNFISLGLFLKYLGLCFFSVIGAIQVAAGGRGIEGLSLLPASLRRWQMPGGVALILASFAVFFAITPEVFTPGLAGAELVTLFGLGGFLALIFVLAVAQVREGLQAQGIRPDEVFPLPQCEGALYGLSSEANKALCLIPDPQEPLLLDGMASRLAREGFLVMVLHWKQPPGFEATMGVLALAVEHLMKDRGIGWVGLVGHRLGGDIALRYMGEDEELKTAVAIAPFLEPEKLEPGLEWLEETGFIRAWRRFQGKEETLRELAPLRYLGELEGRPCLLISQAPLAFPKWDNIKTVEVDEKPWRMASSERVTALVIRWLRSCNKQMRSKRVALV